MRFKQTSKTQKTPNKQITTKKEVDFFKAGSFQ